ncbi:MAG: diguanylate cyclase, partial [Comamonadaceae bacterium]
MIAPGPQSDAEGVTAALSPPDASPNTPWGLLTTTADGTIIDVNLRFASWTGRSRDALCGGMGWKQLLAPASRILYETHFVPRLEAQGAVSEVSLDLAREDGSRFPILASALRQAGKNADLPTTISITVFDATETRRFEQVLRTARRDAEAATEALSVSHRSLRAEHERLQVMLRSIADAVMTTDGRGRITSFNPTAEAITGVPAASALGAALEVIGRLLEAESRREVKLESLQQQIVGPSSSDFVLVRADGVECFLEGTAAPIRDERGQIEGCVYVWRDVTQRRVDAAQRRFEATHDKLTLLLNRREFERLVGQQLEAAESEALTPSLLLHIDLDQFKVINDTAGAHAGDEVLVGIAHLLRESLRQTDVLARLGADEFGVLLPRRTVAEGRALANTLRQRIEDYRLRRGETVHMSTASIGMTVLPERGGSAEGALASAGLACRAAKEAGRNRVHAVSAEDTDIRQRREQMGWVARIRRDLSEGRFELFYQPIVPVRPMPDALPHGELLLRLRDDQGQPVAPGAIITAAERYHQMGHIDRWVLLDAFDWLDLNPGVQVSINVSGQSFGDADFLDYVLRQMAGRKFD